PGHRAPASAAPDRSGRGGGTSAAGPAACPPTAGPRRRRRGAPRPGGPVRRPGGRAAPRRASLAVLSFFFRPCSFWPVLGVVLLLLVAVPHGVEPGVEGEGDPLAGLVAEVEVLMLDAAGLDRQEDDVAGLPVGPATIADRVAPPLRHEQGQPALVDVHPAVGVDLVAEADPVGVGQVGAAEVGVEAAASLPVELPFLLGALDQNCALGRPLPAGVPPSEYRRQSAIAGVRLLAHRTSPVNGAKATERGQGGGG